MVNGGEAADQIVKMSLEAGEAALRISGAGAKQLIVMLYAILKGQKKTRGRVKLEALLNTGKPLTVFSVRESNLAQFTKQAKRYGIAYFAVRNSKGGPDGMVDIMVKSEDAPRINRIVERFKFACVSDVAEVRQEILKDKAEKGRISPEEQLLEELFLQSGIGEDAKENPFSAKTEKPALSEPTSDKSGEVSRGISDLPIPETPEVNSFQLLAPEIPERPSVRQMLAKIQTEKKQEAFKLEEPIKSLKKSQPIRRQQPINKKRKGDQR